MEHSKMWLLFETSEGYIHLQANTQFTNRYPSETDVNTYCAQVQWVVCYCNCAAVASNAFADAGASASANAHSF